MNLNPKLTLGIVTGVVSTIGMVGTYVFCFKKNIYRSEKKDGDDIQPSQENIFDNKSDFEFVDNASAQVEAELINTLYALRMNQLLKRLAEIDSNHDKAEIEIMQLKEEVNKIISSNRGGKTGMHGFIGESAQVHIANVNAFLKGEKQLYVLLDDNSMTDYLRGMQLIQQKACQSDNHLGLDHVKRHALKYPEFINKGGIYQIPKDFYEIFIRMKNLSENEALKLRKEELRIWKSVQTFLSENKDIKIESMEVTYREIQAGNIQTKINEVEVSTEKQFSKQKEDARIVFGPNVNEFIKVVGISALFEGVTESVGECIIKFLHGKNIKDFDKKDSIEIMKKFFVGFIRGGIRSAAIYLMTNILKLSSSVASCMITTGFSLIKNFKQYYKREAERFECFANMIKDTLSIAISTIGAYVGKNVLKNYPTLGAMLGSAVASVGTDYIIKYVYE